MPDKFALRPVAGFLLRFVVIFGVSIAPWRGWNTAYAAYYQAFGQTVFNLRDSNRVVELAPYTGKLSADFDTELILKNRALVDPDGRTPLKAIALNSRSVGWVPTALTLALVAATPIPWRRRFTGLLAGLVLIHLFIFFTLQVCIWNNSTALSLLSLSAFWQNVTDQMKYALVDQLGVSFSVPVIIWILVTFRRQDELA